MAAGTAPARRPRRCPWDPVVDTGQRVAAVGVSGRGLGIVGGVRAGGAAGGSLSLRPGPNRAAAPGRRAGCRVERLPRAGPAGLTVLAPRPPDQRCSASKGPTSHAAWNWPGQQPTVEARGRWAGPEGPAGTVPPGTVECCRQARRVARPNLAEFRRRTTPDGLQGRAKRQEARARSGTGRQAGRRAVWPASRPWAGRRAGRLGLQAEQSEEAGQTAVAGDTPRYRPRPTPEPGVRCGSERRLRAGRKARVSGRRALGPRPVDVRDLRR